MKKLIFETKNRRQVVDITDTLNNFLKDNNIREGVINLLLTHTTAALTTADLDPGMDQDMLLAFDKVIPKLGFDRHHDPSAAPDHLISTLIGATLTLIVENGTLVLGTWQRVILIEFAGPRERVIVIQW